MDEIAKGLTMASSPKDDDEEEEGWLDGNMLLRPVKIASVTILQNYTRDDTAGESIVRRMERKSVRPLATGLRKCRQFLCCCVPFSIEKN